MSADNGPARPKEPIDSATVILTRETDSKVIEVFLMRRHRAQSFMGGAYVFPGGRLDDSDLDPALAELANGLSGAEAGRLLQEPELAGDRALGLFFCVVRELFEEAGVLLARDRTGGLVSFDGDSRFGAYRKKLHEGGMTLLELARKEGLGFALDLLHPFSHWITPEIEKKRFNTRFMLAMLPEGQEAAHDDVELVDSVWLTPARALEEHAAGGIMLMPPTLKTLEELSEIGPAPELFKAARARAIHPILPQGFKTDGGFGVLLPHDPDYSIEGFKQPSRPDETSRLVLVNGRWKAVKAG